MNKIALITGATSGFGKAIAQRFAKEKWNCIITGRRENLLHQLADELRDAYGIRVLSLVFDVSKKEEVFQHLENLPEDWQQIDVLVNNAGLALGRDSFENADIEDWDIMLDTNVKGLAYVTKAVLPFMIKQKHGHVINIGSISGQEVYVNGNMYCATKFAVKALSQGMRMDLLKHNIRVTAIHPGAAETEFSNVRFKGDAVKAKEVYNGYKPLLAEDVADVVAYAANTPPHVCINELTIMATAQASSYLFNKE